MLLSSNVNHSSLLSVCFFPPLPLTCFTVSSSLSSASHSRPSDLSRCFHPLPHSPSLVYTCSIAHLKHTPLICWLTNSCEVVSVSQISTMLHGSLQVNLAGGAAAAQFAHLRQSMEITQYRERITETHTKAHTHALVQLIVGY